MSVAVSPCAFATTGEGLIWPMGCSLPTSDLEGKITERAEEALSARRRRHSCSPCVFSLDGKLENFHTYTEQGKLRLRAHS